MKTLMSLSFLARNTCLTQALYTTALMSAVVLLLNACRALPSAQVHPIEFRNGILNVDGRLDESWYRSAPFTASFKAASRIGATVPETKAWLWWNDRGLGFAFMANDDQLKILPPSADEHAVDVQDRVEVFLWPEKNEQYYCMEIAPSGAVHDYSARYYRRFNDTWYPEGAQFAGQPTPQGYSVEGFLPVSALLRMGIAPWKSGTRFRLGLFRADFSPGSEENPLWLTWIDPKLPKADFHVRETFESVVLCP